MGNISKNIPLPIIYPQNGRGKRNTWLAGQPVGQTFQQKRATARRAGWMDPARPFFVHIWPAGWPANYEFSFPHPFLGYIIGIGISLDIFSLMGCIFPVMASDPGAQATGGLLSIITRLLS